MLNRLFSQLCELDGVNHVRLSDQFGNVIQATSKWPDTMGEQQQEWATCSSIATNLGLGQLFEAWAEGRRLTLHDRFSNDLFVHLSGKDGKKGVWRYELERLRKEWNAQQTQVI